MLKLKSFNSKWVMVVGSALLIILVAVALMIKIDNDKKIDASNPRTAAQEISWTQAQDYLAGCKVSGVSQTHSLEVTLTLRSGERKITTEPRIDAVFDEVQLARDTGCPDIILETE